MNDAAAASGSVVLDVVEVVEVGVELGVDGTP